MMPNHSSQLEPSSQPPRSEGSRNEKIQLNISTSFLHHASRDANIEVHCIPQEAGIHGIIGKAQLVPDESGWKSKIPIIADFVFESLQPISFHVLEPNETQGIIVKSIGHLHTTMNSIINSKDQTCTYTLEGVKNTIAGELTVHADKIRGGNSTLISWQWSARNLVPSYTVLQKMGSVFKLGNAIKPGELNPFLKFLRVRSTKNAVEVARTNVFKESSNPLWDKLQVPLDKLCDNPTSSIRVECWNWMPEQRAHLIGACETTLEAIRSGAKQFELHDPKTKKITGTLEVVLHPDEIQVQEYSFLDYIKCGTQIKTIVATDFTGSSSSLHQLLPKGKPNEYEQAITSICEILLPYDRDRSPQVYGFGGIPHYPELTSKVVSHCFPCTGKPGQPEVQSLDDIRSAYTNSVRSVKFAGPRCFAPVLKEAVNTSRLYKEKNEDVYTVLVILTAGEVEDAQESIDAIIEALELPLSVIIVGIGKGKFSNVKAFDGIVDHAGPKSKGALRDIVQFLPVKHFSGDTNVAVKNLLRGIPSQFMQYMKLVGRKPKI